MRFIQSLLPPTLFILGIATCLGQEPIVVPDGYATLNGGTTGGGNATPVLVSTGSDFRSVAGNDDPAVIVVQGRIDVGSVTIGSNKTIVGADTSAGLYGGHIKVDGRNYIFQNLIIGPSDNDALELSGATNVFIHKCEFYDGADGNLDIVRGSDYVTVSWCKFYYVDQTNHKFSILLGNGDDVTTDRGKLHVTLHHNWFAEKCTSRMPRVRYGHVHIYNNYYNSLDNNYCIGVGVECHIRVENTHFDSINKPWADYGGTENGEIGWSGLKFDNCTQPTFMPNAYPVFPLPYAYELDEVDAVRELVLHPEYGAGNKMIGREPPTTPIIEVSRDSIEVIAGLGQEIPDDTFQVWNDGIDVLNYQIEKDAEWFSISPGSGSSDGASSKVSHTISFTDVALEAGEYTATITVVDNGSGAIQDNVEIPVLLVVGPRIGIEPSTLETSTREGENPDPVSLSIWNTGKDTLLYELSYDVDWMQVEPTSGSSSGAGDRQDHTITFDTTALPHGQHTGIITVAAPGTGVLQQTIPVSVVVDPIPLITPDKETLALSVVKGAYPDTATFEVWNSGTGELEYSVSENIAWLTVSPGNSSSQGPGDRQVHSVYVNPRGLAIGEYTGTINLVADDAPNSPLSISLSLSVLDPNASPWDPDENGDTDTGSFLGWINVRKAPWIWAYSLDTWLFVNEDTLTETGGWVYFPENTSI